MPPVESGLQAGLSLAAFKKSCGREIGRTAASETSEDFFNRVDEPKSRPIHSSCLAFSGHFVARDETQAISCSKGKAARHWFMMMFATFCHLAVPDWGFLQVHSHFLSRGFTTKSQARHETVCESTVLSHSLLACNSAGMHMDTRQLDQPTSGHAAEHLFEAVDTIKIHESSIYGGFLKWGYPKMDGL